MTDVLDPEHPLSDGAVTLRPDVTDRPDELPLRIEHAGAVVGSVTIRDLGDGVADLTWQISPEHRGHGHATRALRLAVGYAFAELDYERLEARVPPGELGALRVAGRAGLRREGVLRGRDGDVLLLARLRIDPDPFEPTGFRALLNSSLPRKRAIAQVAVRDGTGRLLMCHLTYKHDWDFPGGVVEDDESPHAAAEREVREELGLALTVGRLLLVDWLPAWGGWDDACVFMFDGGVHEASLADRIVPEPREIRAAAFCDQHEIEQRCTDFTARRAEVVLRDDPSPLIYLESGC
jgi:8-oxo-dGTP pyrophosphatase MutT (NUDIX family)